MTFAAWFFGVWLFPLIPLWIINALSSGEVPDPNPLEWDLDLRMMLAIWTILCWFVGGFLLLCLLLPQH